MLCIIIYLITIEILVLIRVMSSDVNNKIKFCYFILIYFQAFFFKACVNQTIITKFVYSLLLYLINKFFEVGNVTLNTKGIFLEYFNTHISYVIFLPRTLSFKIAMHEISIFKKLNTNFLFIYKNFLPFLLNCIDFYQFNDSYYTYLLSNNRYLFFFSSDTPIEFFKLIFSRKRYNFSDDTEFSCVKIFDENITDEIGFSNKSVNFLFRRRWLFSVFVENFN